MKIEKYYNYKLCYVDQEDEYSSITTLYFTNDMGKQWGDDWEMLLMNIMPSLLMKTKQISIL